VRRLQTHIYESIEVNLYSPLRTGFTGFRLDAADRAIVRHLQSDGRASFLELARSANISPSAARLRLRRLIHSNAVKVVGVPARKDDPGPPSLGVGINIQGDLDTAVDRVRSLEPEFLATTIGEYEIIATLSANATDEVIALSDSLRLCPEIRSVRTWANFRVIKEEYGRGDRLPEE
jgi:DNA-binding Lrp family transcriptional regulator